MDTLTNSLSENQRTLDTLLGVGRNYDVINRDLYVGSRKGRLYVIDGYGDDGVIERIISFLLGRGGDLAAEALTEYCVTPEDVIAAFPRVFSELQGN